MKKYLLLILFVGILLRVYRFGSVPNELNRDEAALGYNAYAVAFYGLDEWHVAWPVAFKSFGDYKLPGYIYTLMPLVRVFGTSPFIIRLPSLLAGIGLIGMAYLLSNLWFKDKRVAVLAAALTATAPFAIFYSRMAFEANLGLFYLSLALYIYCRPFRWLNLTVGSLFYLLAIFTYNTPLLLAPVLMGFFVFFLPTTKQRIATTAAVFCIACIGFVSLFAVFSQKQSITLFSDPTYILEQQAWYMNSKTLFEKAWNHRLVYFPRQIATRFGLSLLPAFLTQRGGANPWHSAPGTGHLLWSGFGLWLLAIGVTLATTKQSKKALLILGFLLLAFLPAVVTVDAPHATRSLVAFYIMGIFGALVVRTWPKILLGLLLVLFVEGLWYGYRYQTTMNQVPANGWPVNLRESLAAAPPDIPVVITGKPGEDIRADQAYIFVLLFNTVSPLVFQDTVVYDQVDVVGLSRVKSFDSVYFLNDNEPKPEPFYRISKNDQGIYEAN